jgi:predicted RNase H-like HicB family nuclease
MSAKSKKSAKGIDRPFASATLARAREIAAQYQVILSREGGHWYGRGLELPHIFGDGATPAKCVAKTEEAFVGVVALMLEEGQKPPMPARQGRRTQQVNIRLSAEEKLILENAANRKGFTGVSDFVRAVVLESAGR